MGMGSAAAWKHQQYALSTYKPHDDYVACLSMRGDRLLSGGGDGTLALTRLPAKAASTSSSPSPPDGVVCRDHISPTAITACQLLGAYTSPTCMCVLAGGGSIALFVVSHRVLARVDRGSSPFLSCDGNPAFALHHHPALTHHLLCG